MLTYERVSLRNLHTFLKLSISKEQMRILHTSNLKTFLQSLVGFYYSKLFLIRENGNGGRLRLPLLLCKNEKVQRGQASDRRTVPGQGDRQTGAGVGLGVPVCP